MFYVGGNSTRSSIHPFEDGSRYLIDTLVPPESIFDIVGKETDLYRCSLRPETVEALI